MEDPKENLKTIKQLDKIGRHATFRPPSTQLKTIGKRLVYLHKKKKKIQPESPGPNFLDDEIDALFWLLAEYQESSGKDVTETLKLAKDSERINFHKFDSVLEKIRRKKAREPEQGLEEQDGGSEN